MNLETKVGAFVLAGLLVAAVSIMKLTDVRFGSRYEIYFVFDDVQGLREKSEVKIAGVEVGKAKKIELVNGKARITASIRSDVPIYANARVRVNLIGLIGSQFLDLKPGTPEAPRLKDGDTIYGEKSKSLNDLIEKLDELVEGTPGKPGIGENLQATMKNLRNISDSLNEAIGKQSDELKDMVQNFNDFSYDLKGMASDLHHITASKKEDIEVAITKLRSLLERVDDVVARVQKGEGAVGKLVADKEMGEEVKKTVSNLKDTSASAKEVLARFTKVRSFWEAEARYSPAADSWRGDGGVRLQPRDGKYYYIGINNAGAPKDEYRSRNDYEKKNTITAVLGKQFGPVTVELGALRSSAGVGLRYYPFQDIATSKALDLSRERPADWKDNIELDAQAFDFARDEDRGQPGHQRHFKGPQYDVGAGYRLNRWVEIGASVEDLAEVKQYNLRTRFIFEDRDLAYLFGFVSFAR